MAVFERYRFYWRYTHLSLNHDYGRKGNPYDQQLEKIIVSFRNILFQGYIFRFHVICGFFVRSLEGYTLSHMQIYVGAVPFLLKVRQLKVRSEQLSNLVSGLNIEVFGTPKPAVLNGWKGDFQTFPIKIWFIIQLKQPFLNRCFRFQDVPGRFLLRC